MIWLLLSVVMAFTPTTEWQLVPEGVAIPKGLEIKMELGGEQYARLPPEVSVAGQDSEDRTSVKSVEKPRNVDVGRPILPLDQLEELAHDIDHGQEFMEQYGAHLATQYEEGPDDQAGKVLGIAVRNNPSAATSLLAHDPEFPSRLASRLSSRDLYILANLVTAQFAAVEPALKLAETQAASATLNRSQAKQMVRLVRDVSHVDKAAVGRWVGVFELALQNTDDNRPEADGVRLELLRGLTEIVEGENEFKEIVPRPKVSSDFVAWIAEQAVRSDPGKRSDKDASTSSEFLQYVKQVRHRVYGNRKAERLHMDL